MQYFRINTDLESYRKTFPGSDEQNVIHHWMGTEYAYLTPSPGTNQYRNNLSRIAIGDVLFAYQSGTGIVAFGEAQETWDAKSYWGEPGLYIDSDQVYKIRVRWYEISPAVPFSDIKSAGLGTAVGALSEIPNAEVGATLRALCAKPRLSAPDVDKDRAMTNMANMIPLNQILYGPPGTGKTYATVVAALEILDPAFLQANAGQRSSLKARFDELVRSQHIRFVTFHQSFSYEDFVEGLRAENGPEGELRYTVEPGVFKALCEEVSVNPDLAEGEAPIGPYPVGQRFGNGYIVCRSTPDVLELEKPNGSSLELGMRLLDTLADYVRRGILSINDIAEKQVFDKVLDTKLERYLVNGYNNILPALVSYVLEKGKAGALAPAPEKPMPAPSAKVLIIDEINRGNVAKIFGELITLIEPSKRSGAVEALETVLPYSKTSFSVPQNVYLVGTMNTADRSLASVDIALRRRFIFREMVPDLAEMQKIRFEGLDLATLLDTINLRVEALLDREHRIGHAYFMPLKDAPTIGHLALIFRRQILPLLQEYFFEDCERVRWVLNDHRKKPEHQFISRATLALDELFGDVAPNLPHGATRWTVNDAAFNLLQSYTGIIEA